MAQSARGGPFREADLGHQLRCHPRHPALPYRRRVGERRGVPAERPQPCAQRVQRLLVKTGADLAGVLQLAVAEVAQQQRAEVGARALGRGEAADDQLLAGLAFELEPVAGSLGLVWAVRALGYDALPPLAAC